MNKMLTEQEERCRNQMTEAVKELSSKASMFNGAENSLAAKDAELMRMEGKYKTNTNLMYAYETEKDRLAVRLAEAEHKVK